MIADIMGLLNIDQVNKFTKDERKNGLFCDKTVLSLCKFTK